MVELLVAAAEDLQVAPCRDDLLAVHRAVDRQQAKLSEALGEFDRAQLWELDAATSLVAWLRNEAGMHPGEAAATARVARRLTCLPALRQAWIDGRLSGGQVRAIVANLDETSAPLFAEHEAEVVPTLVGLSVADTATAAQAWRAMADAVQDRPPPPERPCAASIADTLDGRAHLSADLTPEGNELARAALKLFESRDAAGELRTPQERRGDALVALFRYACEHKGGRRSARRRAHLNLIVDWDEFLAGSGSVSESGRPIDPVTTARLACDAVLHRVLTTGPSAILDYGRGSYAVPADLWHALVVRDQGCRWPGCDRGPDWCDAHHVLPWEDGGRTALENLVLACSRHHHLGHRPGWQIKLLPDATVEVTSPDGRHWQSRPPGPDPLRLPDLE